MAPPFDTFHAYVYATGVWYFIRSCARLYDPYMVYTWFSNERVNNPALVEIYNLRTDGIGLTLLSMFMFLLPSFAAASSPVALASSLSPSTSTATKAAILASMAHHAGTAWFAYWQWADLYTSTGAMLLGWTVSGGLVALGALALLGIGGPEMAGDGMSLRNGKKLK